MKRKRESERGTQSIKTFFKAVDKKAKLDIEPTPESESSHSKTPTKHTKDLDQTMSGHQRYPNQSTPYGRPTQSQSLPGSAYKTPNKPKSQRTPLSQQSRRKDVLNSPNIIDMFKRQQERQGSPYYSSQPSYSYSSPHDSGNHSRHYDSPRSQPYDLDRDRHHHHEDGSHYHDHQRHSRQARSSHHGSHHDSGHKHHTQPYHKEHYSGVKGDRPRTHSQEISRESGHSRNPSRDTDKKLSESGRDRHSSGERHSDQRTHFQEISRESGHSRNPSREADKRFSESGRDRHSSGERHGDQRRHDRRRYKSGDPSMSTSISSHRTDIQRKTSNECHGAVSDKHEHRKQSQSCRKRHASISDSDGAESHSRHRHQSHPTTSGSSRHQDRVKSHSERRGSTDLWKYRIPKLSSKDAEVFDDSKTLEQRGDPAKRNLSYDFEPAKELPQSLEIGVNSATKPGSDGIHPTTSPASSERKNALEFLHSELSKSLPASDEDSSNQSSGRDGNNSETKVKLGIENLKKIMGSNTSPQSGTVSPVSPAHGDNMSPVQQATRSPAQQDTCTYEDNSERFTSFGSDDDSDDDHLIEAHAVLQTFRNLSNKPAPDTPVKSPVAAESGSSEVKPIFSGQTKPDTSKKFSLNDLLAEKIEKDEMNKELAKMEEDLWDGIEKGGMHQLIKDDLNLDTVEEVELNPDQQQVIDRLAIQEETIMNTHPGDVIFHPEFFKCLFTETLTLSSCGFSPGSSHIDRMLARLSDTQPDLLLEFLTCDTIPMCFHNVSSPHAFLTWLYKLMSVHPNSLVTRGAFRILYNILHDADQGSSWVPSVEDTVRVFVNYGATFENLSQHKICKPLYEAEKRCYDDSGNLGNHRPDGAIENGAIEGGYKIESLQSVIQILAYALQKRGNLYSVEDLSALAVLVCRGSLDEMLNCGDLQYDVQVCMSAILNCYTEQDWPKKCNELCQIIPQITSHHHNLVSLSQIMPATTRGYYMQRRLAYTTLCTLVGDKNISCTDLKVKYFLKLVPHIKAAARENLYLVYSMLTLLDFALGNEALRSAEKEDVLNLNSLVRQLGGFVKDDIKIPDRQTVKNFIAQLVSRWTFVWRTMGSKQATLYHFMSSKNSQEATVEEVKCSQDASDQSDEEMTETINQSNAEERSTEVFDRA